MLFISAKDSRKNMKVAYSPSLPPSLLSIADDVARHMPEDK